MSGLLNGFARTALFDRCLMEYHVCNWVKRSTETVSVHAKPYRAGNGERPSRLITANSFSVSLFDIRKNTTSGKRQRIIRKGMVKPLSIINI